MSIGNSGRIVIEMEPEIKKQLHAVLRLEGKNLKSWFLENVDELLEQYGQQQDLPFDEAQNTKEVRR